LKKASVPVFRQKKFSGWPDSNQQPKDLWTNYSLPRYQLRHSRCYGFSFVKRVLVSHTRYLCGNERRISKILILWGQVECWHVSVSKKQNIFKWWSVFTLNLNHLSGQLNNNAVTYFFPNFVWEFGIIPRSVITCHGFVLFTMSMIRSSTA
jgi:hypothetical protein